MKLLQIPKKRILLNITPLIDMLFILIIFFVVSSTFLEQPGIKLELPKAASSESQRVEKAVLYITSESKLFLVNRKLPSKACRALSKTPWRYSRRKA